MLGWRGAAAVLRRRVFSSIPGLSPLDASSTSPPSCNDQNHLQISPKVPEGAKYTPGFLENLWAMEILWAWEQVGETEAISTSERVSPALHTHHLPGYRDSMGWVSSIPFFR